MATCFVFPEMDTLDGGKCKVEISVQEFYFDPTLNSGLGGWVFDDFIDINGDPLLFDQDDIVTLAENPILEDGLDITDSASKDPGAIGLRSATITCANIPVLVAHPTYGTKTLSELFGSVDVSRNKWHIRFSFLDAGASPPYPAPYLWGFLELPDTSGSAGSLYNPDEQEYSFEVCDLLSMLDYPEVNRTVVVKEGGEAVTKYPFLESYLAHSDIDYSLDGDATVYFSQWASDAGLAGIRSRRATGIFAWSRDGFTHYYDARFTRFAALKTIIYQIGRSVGIKGSINGGNDVDCSTRWVIFDGTNEVEKKWDDLYIVSGIFEEYTTYIQTDSFFEQRSDQNIVSYTNVGNALELIKYILMPFGLTVEVRHESVDFRPYLYIREYQEDVGVDKTQLILSSPDPEVEPGDRAAFGLEVATANDGTFKIGAANDRNIDNPYMGGLRITNSTHWRWQESVHYIHDSQCFMQGLYALHGSNTFYAPGKVIIKNAGRGSLTVGEWQHLAKVDAFSHLNTHGLGILHSVVCAFIHFNSEITGDTGTAPVGEFGRISQGFSFSTGDTDRTTRRGQYIYNVPSLPGKWVVVEKTIKPFRNETEFTAERRAFSHSPA